MFTIFSMIIVVPHVIKNQYITILFYQLSYVSKKFIRYASCIGSSSQEINFCMKYCRKIRRKDKKTRDGM